MVFQLRDRTSLSSFQINEKRLLLYRRRSCPTEMKIIGSPHEKCMKNPVDLHKGRAQIMFFPQDVGGSSLWDTF
jgi:hypothetical protein